MKISVWYHCVLNGPRIPSEDHAVSIMVDQMHALNSSGLVNAANEIHIGVNGSDSQALTAYCFTPPRTGLHIYNDGQSELTTMTSLQKWLEPGWAVLYHHIKGVQYPGNTKWDNWRHCMERVCVHDWRICLKFLENGYDTVGAHWLTHKKFPMVGEDQRYWGGNFWWATSDYLLTLPELPTDSHENRYQAEVWIGESTKSPVVHDFAPHWPMECK